MVQYYKNADSTRLEHTLFRVNHTKAHSSLTQCVTTKIQNADLKKTAYNLLFCIHTIYVLSFLIKNHRGSAPN